MPTKTPTRPAPARDAGFTLVEALVAIVVLVFGLMAVTNLMVVAASSNTVANQGTAAVTSASRIMDLIKSTSFEQLSTGGSLLDPADAGSAPDCDVAVVGTDWHCNDDVPGVGSIHTHWQITATNDVRILHIRVQSEGLGSLAGARSRSDFTTFRACTNVDSGCPDPNGPAPTPSPSPTP